MPVAPEIAEVRGPVGAAEIQREADPEDEAEADGDEGISGEIEVDPHAEGEALQPDMEGIRGVDLEFFGKETEVIGDDHLVGESEDDPAERGIDVLRMDAEAVGLDLGEEIIAFLDGAGDDLGEKGGEVEVIEEGGAGRGGAEVVHPEADGLEGVEGKPHRDEDGGIPHIKAEGLVDEEIPVFVVEERCQLRCEKKDEENGFRRARDGGRLEKQGGPTKQDDPEERT